MSPAEIVAKANAIGVTLDGKPATVCGYRNRFATVRQNGTGLSAEWAWETVERIVTTKCGRFYS